MAAPWQAFRAKMKEKRTGKNRGPAKVKCNQILQNEEIVIQMLSSEVSGKAQKYTRVGPREFVPYGYDDISQHKACMYGTFLGNDTGLYGL